MNGDVLAIMTELGKIKSELQKDIGDFKSDLKDDIGDLKASIAGSNGSFTAEINWAKDRVSKLEAAGVRENWREWMERGVFAAVFLFVHKILNALGIKI